LFQQCQVVYIFLILSHSEGRFVIHVVDFLKDKRLDGLPVTMSSQ